MIGANRKLALSVQSPLEEGAAFELNKRRGTVVQLRPTSCLVLWDEFVDAETGEIFPPVSEVIPHEEISRNDMNGRLRILSRPSVLAAAEVRGRVDRNKKEIARMNWRLCFVKAAQTMIDEGRLQESRASFVEQDVHLLSLGSVYYNRYLLDQAGASRKRGGAQVNLGPQSKPSTSPAQIFKWFLKHQRGGENALFDSYGASGNRRGRYSEAEQELMRSVIDSRLDGERCSIASLHSSVDAVFRAYNEQAARQQPPGPVFNIPGYDYVRSVIDDMAPLDHMIRTRGLKHAHQSLHPLGVGVKTSRALERVEVDEYTTDLMVILRDLGIWDWLQPEERLMIGLDGATRRVALSIAIDVHTRCIVGMQISASETTSLFRETLEMIFMDKTPNSDAVGAHEPWKMHGRPERIVLDRGPNYVPDTVYDLIASLGFTNMGAPAKKPWLRPYVERFFRTLHNGLLQRFTGRTFSNVVQRGENDAAERASMSIDEFLHWLVRWIVEIYHLTPQEGLNGLTPAEAWDHSQTVSRLQAVSRSELRKVFGIRRIRKLGPAGIDMMHINYQTKDLARIFLGPGGKRKTFEVAWWPHDIGAIEVKVAPDHWMTVTATDPMWIGKSFDDLAAIRRRLAAERDRSDAVKARALADLDAAAYRAKALRGILPTTLTDATYDRTEDEYLRFMKTAETEFDAPDFEGLFDGVVDLSADLQEGEVAADDAPGHPAPAQPVPKTSFEDDDDLME
ncbi:hypothetical protein V8J36_20645 [Frigidibacter sp. MR17.14]|uniref:hypothetical protein n=1 Tax=Frigidibacter sp. MR17.14 TaxID=3126509 RepID=UPI003012EC9C